MTFPDEEETRLAIGGELELKVLTDRRRRNALLRGLEGQVVDSRECRRRVNQVNDSQSSARIGKVLGHDGDGVVAAPDQVGKREDQDRQKYQEALEQISAV